MAIAVEGDEKKPKKGGKDKTAGKDTEELSEEDAALKEGLELAVTRLQEVKFILIGSGVFKFNCF